MLDDFLLLNRAGGQQVPVYPPDDDNHVNMSNLSTWRAAKASGNAKVLVYGDSIGTGLLASPTSLGYLQKFASDLASTYGAGGEWLTSQTSAERARWTVGTGWTQQYWGVTASGYMVNSASAGTLSCTMTGSKFEFYALRSSNTGNGLIFKIDGVAVATIGRSQAAWAYEKAIVDTTPGSHLIEVNTNTGTTIGAVCGILSRTTSAPIVINNAASGATLSSYSNYEDYRLKAVPVFGADLTILEFVANDYNTQTTLATFTSRLALLGSYAKQNNKSVLLITCPRQNSSLTIPQTSYETVMEDYASTYGLAYYNIGGVWGSWATAQAAGYMGGDSIHPNTEGHAAIYNDIKRWL